MISGICHAHATAGIIVRLSGTHNPAPRPDVASLARQSDQAGRDSLAGQDSLAN